ncbi:hypothetical protein G6F68_013821 [Rhizopus microsporus]|nr:hypothetical protein G6F68_013821 [Rhizopus microsporus]
MLSAFSRPEGADQAQGRHQQRIAAGPQQLRADGEHRSGLGAARHRLHADGRQAGGLAEEGQHASLRDDLHGVAGVGRIHGGLEAVGRVACRAPVPAPDLQAAGKPVLGQRALPRRTVVTVVRRAQFQALGAGQRRQVGDLLRIAVGPEQLADLDQPEHGQQRQHDQHHGDRHAAAGAVEAELAWAFHGLHQRPDEVVPLDLPTSVSKKSGISCWKLLR